MKNKLENIIKLLFVAILSFISTVLFITMVEIAYLISYHPLPSLMMRFVFLSLLLVALILKSKEIFIYYFLLCFPFMRIAFNGISLLTIFALLFLILYFKEISILIYRKQNIFAKPFIFLLIIMIYTTLLARHHLEALSWDLFYFSLAIVYFVLTVYMNSFERIKRILFIILVVFVLAVLVSLFQFKFGINSIKFFFGEYNINTNIYGFERREPSFFQDSQEAGLFFATGSFLILGLISMIKKGRILLYFVFIIILLCLLLTITRIALLGLFIGWSVFIMLNFSFRKAIILGFLLTFSLITGSLLYQTVLPASIKGRLSKQSQEKSFNFRYKIWKESIPLAITNPWGVGLGGDNLYDAGIERKIYIPIMFKKNILSRKFTHFENSYLGFLYSMGFLGFGAFIFLIIKYFSTAQKVAQKIQYNKFFLYYLMSGMVTWLVCALTSPEFYNVQAMIVFILLLAFVTVGENVSQKTSLVS